MRRTAQHHRYLGRRLTDRQLAELLASKGRKTTTGAVKKFRQRLAKRGTQQAEITNLIFAKCGLPYRASTDPVEAWDFPIEFRESVTRLYPNFRGTNETRIQYFIRWLQQQIQQLEKHRTNPLTAKHQQDEIGKLVSRYQTELQQVRNDYQDLHQKSVDKLLAESGVQVSAPPQIPQAIPPSGDALIPLPVGVSDEQSTADQQRQLEQQRRRENLEYLAGIIKHYCPSAATVHIDSDISDGQLQRYANHGYFAVMNKGNDTIREVLREYQKRGIPQPGASMPADLDVSDIYPTGTVVCRWPAAA